MPVGTCDAMRYFQAAGVRAVSRSLFPTYRSETDLIPHLFFQHFHDATCKDIIPVIGGDSGEVILMGGIVVSSIV